MAAPTPFLPGLARGEEWSENGGPEGSRIWEKGMDGGDPPNLPDPPKLVVVPVTCRSSRPRAAHSPPPLQRAP